MVHDLSDVLNPNHSPGSREDQELFKVQQATMHSVLVRTLMTDKGKALTRDPALAGNSQGILRELSDHHEKSTKADLDGTDRPSHIMTCTFGNADSNWKGTARGQSLA